MLHFFRKQVLERNRTAPPRPHPRRLRFEGLEARQMMTGNVASALIGVAPVVGRVANTAPAHVASAVPAVAAKPAATVTISSHQPASSSRVGYALFAPTASPAPAAVTAPTSAIRGPVVMTWSVEAPKK